MKSDFSVEKEVESLEAQYKGYEESYRRNKEMKPGPRPAKNRFEALFVRNLTLIEANKPIAPQHLRRRQTAITGEQHSSYEPLEKLHPITLRQMLVPMVHKGNFLACRVLTECTVTVATEFMCEDVDGDVELVALYNFFTDFTVSTTDWLRPGTILLIKEPYMKYSSAYSQENAFIRVDSPSDVIFVPSYDQNLLLQGRILFWHQPETLPFDELKTKGNELFKRKLYKEALEFYERALALSFESPIVRFFERRALPVNSEWPIIHLNMAATMLALKRFYEAHEHAKKALKMDGCDRAKALYRMGKAAYGLRNWQNAIDHFKEALLASNANANDEQHSKENAQVAEALKKAEQRLAESQSGEYDDFQMIILQSKDRQQLGQEYDVADYTGPIKCVDIEGKGKGLVLTEDVAKGTLLLASKAFVKCDETYVSELMLLAHNLITRKMDYKSQVRLIAECTQKLKRNPQMAPAFYSLYAGQSDQRELPPAGVLDISRIQRICTLNSFGVSPNLEIKGTADELPSCWTGLWLLPSFINHSCIGNVARHLCGDLMFIYAQEDMKRGEEICFSYSYDVFQKSLKERNEKLKKGWAFQCQCRLCQLDGADPQGEKKREKLLEQIYGIKSKGLKADGNVRVMERLLAELRESYQPERSIKYRPILFSPFLILGQMYIKLGQFKKATEMMEQSMEILSHMADLESVVSGYTELTEVLLAQKNFKKAKSVAKQAFAFAKRRAGIKQKELFLQMYPQFEKIL